jgi:6-pyruvoyltetrahydropterin/6-carboxytetrahydropterin synthase
MYKITKEFHFSASHVVMKLPAEHPCSRLHGHNYVIKVELGGEELNEVGMIQDYRELSDIKEWIDENLDHRHLNQQLPINPTAENMAKYLYDLWVIKYPLLTAVEVQETPKTNARYEPSNN